MANKKEGNVFFFSREREAQKKSKTKTGLFLFLLLVCNNNHTPSFSLSKVLKVSLPRAVVRYLI